MQRPSPRFKSEKYFIYDISKEICMETPCWCPTKTSVPQFCYKSMNLFFEELINIKKYFF